jgi:bla regulator protein BlaR1
METSLFILALSKTLPESCLQGLIVFIALKLLFSVFKNSSPALRFNLYYGASVLLFIGFLLTLFQHYGEAQNAALNSFVASNLASSNYIIPVSKPTLSYWTGRYAYTITGLYVMGLVFCVLRLAIGLININWLRKNEQQHESQWNKQAAALAKHFNLVKTVSVYLSRNIQVPLTIGFFKPVIIFPIALVNQLSAAQTEAILLHELAHIKRADYLLNVLLSIIQSFLFFNPIIWLMGREINLYREQCCDDLVLEKTNDTLAYAHALLQIETCRNAQLTLALAANGKKYTLLNRIKRITNMEMNNPSPQNKLIVLLLALTTIGLSVAWNVPAKKEIKHTIATHFKAIKEVLDTNHIEQFANVYKSDVNSQFHSKITSDTVAFQKNDRSGKKLTATGKKMVFNFDADTSIQKQV